MKTISISLTALFSLALCAAAHSPRQLRYSYCLNNPLRYRDEDGEFFFGLVASFFRGIFTWQNPFKTAWRTAVNETKIQLGLLKSDWSHGIFNGMLLLASRFTWESLQTVFGYSYSLWRNWVRDVEVAYYKEATYTIHVYKGSTGVKNGVTMGSFININDKENLLRVFSSSGFDPSLDDMYVHEYGHVRQSHKWGLSYMRAIGVPSLIATALHNADDKWFEVEASTRGAIEFKRRYDKQEKYPVWEGMYYRHTKKPYSGSNPFSSCLNLNN